MREQAGFKVNHTQNKRKKGYTCAFPAIICDTRDAVRARVVSRHDAGE